MDIEAMRRRSAIIAAIRRFFDSRGYLEVETPLLAPALIPERSIEVFATTYRNPFAPPRSLYLIPSPELWMKRLIADGWPSMYQITKAFRNGESVGREHNPEFTILEYYTIDADYEDSFTLTGELLAAVAATNIAARPATDGSEDTGESTAGGATWAGLGSEAPAVTPIMRLTVAEAFSRYADLDLEAELTIGGLRRALSERGMSYGDSDDLEALFNRLFVHLVEPNFGGFPAVALFDYPHAIPTTAKRKPGTPWSERWELYLDGVEVANCYSEETRADEVDAYFEHEAAAKRKALEPHPSDEDYRRMFRGGFPRCSGVALGVDRLVQAVLGFESIEGVILFPLSSIFPKTT